MEKGYSGEGRGRNIEVMEDLAEDRRVGKAGIEGVKKVMGGGLDDGGEGLNLISVDVQEKEDLGREVRASLK